MLRKRSRASAGQGDKIDGGRNSRQDSLLFYLPIYAPVKSANMNFLLFDKAMFVLGVELFHYIFLVGILGTPRSF